MSGDCPSDTNAPTVDFSNVVGAFNAPCSVLDAEQLSFLRLHARRYDPPFKWRWILGGGMLRAYTEGLRSATIDADRLEALVTAGLMQRGPGCADMTITEAGKQAAI